MVGPAKALRQRWGIALAHIATAFIPFSNAQTLLRWDQNLSKRCLYVAKCWNNGERSSEHPETFQDEFTFTTSRLLPSAEFTPVRGPLRKAQGTQLCRILQSCIIRSYQTCNMVSCSKALWYTSMYCNVQWEPDHICIYIYVLMIHLWNSWLYPLTKL